MHGETKCVCPNSSEEKQEAYGICYCAINIRLVPSILMRGIRRLTLKEQPELQEEVLGLEKG